jgi:hypothetical protein
MNTDLEKHLNSLCCEALFLPNIIGGNNTISSQKFQYNFDTGLEFQKPTDEELIAYTEDMGNIDDSNFRTLRGAYSQTQVPYILSNVRKMNDISITTVACRPDGIGKLPSKANFFEIPYIDRIRETTWGFPYDLTFKDAVNNTIDLPLIGINGEVRHVFNSNNFYYWNRLTSSWQLTLFEEVNGVLIDAGDLFNTNRAYVDAHMKALNELLLATTPFTWSNDYLPKFQITNFKL